MEESVKYSLGAKKLMSEDLSRQFKERPNFIITEYFGLSANDLNELRKSLARVSSKYFVMKNSVGRRVLKELAVKDMDELVEGGVGIGFLGGDIVECSKAVVDFSKKHEPLKIKGAYIDGRKLDVQRLKELAELPSRQVLLAMIAGAMKSPITGFVQVMGGLMRKFVYAINAVKEKKEKGGK